MNRLQLNLLLLVVVAALATTIYFTQKKEEKGPALTALNDGNLSRIRIEHPDAAAIELQKQPDGQWRLTEPVAAATDRFEVASLLALTSFERKYELAVADVDLKELGLAPPLYRIQLDDQTLEIGAQEPISFRRYIRVGDQIALIEDPPSAPLDADYSELIAKELLPSGAKIAKIVLPGLTLARSSDAEPWALTPEQADATAAQKQQLADAWLAARSMWNGKMPSDASGEPLTITLQDGSEVHLQIAAREPQLLIDNPALQLRYTLSRALEDSLLKLPQPTTAAPPGAEPAPL